MSGLGGDGFYHAYRRSDGAAVVVNATGAAPAAATAERFGGGLPISGPLAVSTPALVAGLGELHAGAAACPGRRCSSAAIHHAREGFGATPSFRRFTAMAADWLAVDERSKASFLPGGELPPIGTPIRQPALARTLERLAAEGADAFYRGALGRDVARAFAEVGTLVTADDLAACRAELQHPSRRPIAATSSASPRRTRWAGSCSSSSTSSRVSTSRRSSRSGQTRSTCSSRPSAWRSATARRSPATRATPRSRSSACSTRRTRRSAHARSTRAPQPPRRLPAAWRPRRVAADGGARGQAARPRISPWSTPTATRCPRSRASTTRTARA